MVSAAMKLLLATLAFGAIFSVRGQLAVGATCKENGECASGYCECTCAKPPCAHPACEAATFVAGGTTAAPGTDLSAASGLVAGSLA